MKGKMKNYKYYLKIFEKSRMLFLICLITSLLAAAASAGVALLLKKIIDIAVKGDLSRFYNALSLSLAYLAVFALIYYTNSLMSKILIKNVIRNMRKSIFGGIFRRSYQDFNEVNSADYISVLTNDIKMVEDNYINSLMQIIENIMLFIFTLGLLIAISPLITLILFIGFILMLLIPSVIGRKLQKRQGILSEEYSVFTSKIKDYFQGFEVIKSFQLIKRVKTQFDTENDILASKKFKADRLFVLNDTASQFLAVFSQIITIFVSAYLVIKGFISMGTLIALIQLSGSFVVPLINIMQNFPKIQSIAPIIGRMQQFQEYKDSSFNGNILPEFNHKIVISDVCFAYREEQSILKNVNLVIEKNKKYAIVGESGCGKSTLVKLLMGYYSQYTGEIYYDNIKLKEAEADKINQLTSIIHQNVYMFDQSIRDNICLFQNYPKEAIEKAINRSGVDKFLPVMQDKLETLVGENGANLSGGQRQRIAIARAIIKNTPILILDEATSALDQQTARDIEQNLLNNKALTLITVTHKLNEELLGLYDQIIYMEKGHIVEAGSYSELYSAKKGFYHFCVA